MHSERSMAQRPKDPGIETLRGLAILLMVMAHVIGDSNTTGLRVHPDSSFRYLFETLKPLRLPLFTALSGFLYAWRPVTRPDQFGAYLSRKARRLLLPMACVGTIQYLLRVWAPGVNRQESLSGLWRIYVTAFDQFWFLQALFVLFVMVALLDIGRLLVTCRRWAIALALSVWLALAWTAPPLFSTNGAMLLFPYFLLGIGLHRFSQPLRRPLVTAAMLIACVAGVTTLQGVWFSRFTLQPDTLIPISMAAGLGTTALLIRHRRPLPALVRLGSSAYEIFLFHVIATAGTRVLLQQGLGLHNRILLFACGLTAGLGLPLLVLPWLRRHRWTRLLLLGQPAPGDR